MIGTFFKLVGKAIRFSISRPIQRFNIYNRSKKYLGGDAKYFMPAPRAIGALSQSSISQYPHLEGSSPFKSVKQRRMEAIARRNQRLLEGTTAIEESAKGLSPKTNSSVRSFSETKQDDKVVIETSNKLPVIKTVTIVENPKRADAAASDNEVSARPPRPLPTSTNLQLSDPAVIWRVDKVPPGRLDLDKLQQLMINKLADDAYWTPKQLSETYNISEKYAANITEYFKQIRIIISPGIANKLDYVARNDPRYQACKDIIYYVDPSLRTPLERQYDDTFLPTDELDPEVRRVLQGSQRQMTPDPRLTGLIKRPKPLRFEPENRPTRTSQIIDDGARRRLRLKAPANEARQDGDEEKADEMPPKDT